MICLARDHAGEKDMRYVASLFLVSISLAFASQPVHAEETGVFFTVYGIGETPCSAFVELIDVSADLSGRARAEDSEVYQLYKTWLHGYLTGRNQERDDAGKPSIPALNDKLTYMFAAQYCVENPLDTIQEAAEDHWHVLKNWEGIQD